MTTRAFSKALPHGVLRELFKDVFFVTGTVRLGGPVTLSRNMTVVRENGELTLINSLRLDAGGLAALEKLGRVAHVIRLAGFHGMDDPFYKDRYGAKVWSVKGHVYAAGFSPDAKAEDAYFRSDVDMDESTALPLKAARLYPFKSAKGGEALLLLERDGGILVSGDCLQNWHKTDQYFSLLGKWMMKSSGFIKAHNIGPGWLKFAKPQSHEIKGIQQLTYEHVLPAHGAEVVGNAKASYAKAIDRIGG